MPEAGASPWREAVQAKREGECASALIAASSCASTREGGRDDSGDGQK